MTDDDTIHPGPNTQVVDDVSGVSQEHFLRDLNARIRLREWSPITLCTTIILTVALLELVLISPFLAISPTLSLIGGVILTFRLRERDRIRRSIVVYSAIDDSTKPYWNALNTAFEQLRNSSLAWCDLSNGEIKFFEERCFFRRADPPHIRTNVQPWSIDAPGHAYLYFLPGNVLIMTQRRGDKPRYSAFPMGKISFVDLTDDQYQLFDGPAPVDATVAAYRWGHERKDGGPDLRYAINFRYPVVATGRVTIYLNPSGYLSLQVTNVSCALIAAHAFGAAFGAPVETPGAGSDTGDEPERESEPIPPPRARTRQRRSRTRAAPQPPIADSPRPPHEVLGVDPDADQQQIANAYRQLAQQYHPDKVATLAPEIRELAERRMKEINSAYQALRQR